MVQLYRFTFAYLLVLCTLTLNPSMGYSQAQVIDSCRVINYQPIGGHAIWLSSLPGAPTARFVYDSTGGPIYLYSDSTIQLRGTVTHETQSNLQWEVNIWLINVRDYTDWTALGRGFKIEAAPDSIANANVQDWFFFELDESRSTLIGVPGTQYDGDTLFLTHRPRNLEFGFQLGVGANAKTGDDGISGWFGYSGAYSGIGDVNGTFSCDDPPEDTCDVSIDTTYIICDSINGTFSVELVISGTSDYEIRDTEGSPAQFGQAGTYTFGPYPSIDTVVVGFVVEDTLIGNCQDSVGGFTGIGCPDPPVCDVVIDSVTTSCLNDTAFEVSFVLIGSGTYEVGDDQGSASLIATAGNYSFGPYTNNSQVSFYAIDVNDSTCRADAGPFTEDCLPDTCIATLDSVYAVCMGTDSFEVTVTFSGIGSDFSIFDNLGGMPINGVSPGTYMLGPYASNTSVFVTVIDSNFVNCEDVFGPVTADCTPQCTAGIDTAYTQCNTDSTYEVVAVVTGTPVTPGGYTIYVDGRDTFNNPFRIDTISNVLPGTIAFGSYPNGNQVSVDLRDEVLSSIECVVYIDSLNYYPDSTGQPCTSGGNFSGMLDFSMVSNGSEITLSWAIPQHGEETYYWVERKGMSPYFEPIAMLEWRDRDVTTGKFFFKDTDLEENTRYSYRLMQVRPNGINAYSRELRYLLRGESDFMLGDLYPNPAPGNTQIKLNAIDTHQIRCDILDIRGSVVSQTRLDTRGGTEYLEIPSESLSEGLYFVRFHLESGKTYVRKLMIRE